MVLTFAEKQKRYRENLKIKGLYQTMKAKNTARMKAFRYNLAGEKKEDYNKRHTKSQQKYRDKKKVSEYVLFLVINMKRTFILNLEIPFHQSNLSEKQ